MYIKNQKFFVFGLSKSGIALTDLLIDRGGTVYMCDESPEILQNENVDRLIKKGAVFTEIDKIDFIMPLIDVVAVSPGIPINHPLLVKMKRAKKRITGELQLAYDLITLPMVAVTGTNGKTTTVSLIGWILDCCNVKNKTCGNIGVPLSSLVDKIDYDTLAVCEVSSFQLETATDLCPHICCITNISPDHLDRHYNMENYIFLKKRLFANMKESEYLVLNYDDAVVKTFAEQTRAKVIWFSLKEHVENGAYIEEDKVVYNGEQIMNLSDYPLKGEHNAYNLLTAVCALKLLGIFNAQIKNGAESFRGVRHRMETVKTVGGVTYINDSKSTNTASTINAIDSIQSPTVLILGGRGKGEDYDALFDIITKRPITHVVLVGESKYDMLEAANRKSFDKLTLTGDFECAVRVARMVAKNNGCVLLSPACASFDMFEGYEERGNRFCKIVGEFVD